MARAKDFTWFNLIAGLAAGAGAMHCTAPRVLAQPAPEAAQPAPTMGRPSQAHAALNNAIQCYNRGEYEKAQTYFNDALQRQADLTETEEDELSRLLDYNKAALAARRDAAMAVTQAEDLFKSGKAADAQAQLKRVAVNEQYLSPADKDRYNRLSAALRGVTAHPTQPAQPTARPPQSPQGTPGTPPQTAPARPATAPVTSDAQTTAMARSKVREARMLVSAGDFEAGEKLAHQAAALRVSYMDGEDTPAKVLQDSNKFKTDPKQLTVMARAALERHDLDRADMLAKLAEKNTSSWSINVFGDTPSKVMKDIAAARAAAPAPKPAPAQQPTSPANTVANKPETPGSAVPQLGSAAQARALLREGRKAMDAGDFAAARKCGEEAKALKANLAYSEDNPDRFLAELAKAEGVVKANPSQPAGAEVPAGASPKERALALVKLGRQQQEAGKIDDAFQTAQKAKSIQGVKFSLFDDTPDALLTDLEAARGKRDVTESWKVLAEGRRFLEQNDFDNATRSAYKAQRLHGEYSMWELGDRPDRLLSDIQMARAQAKKNAKPAESVVRNNPAERRPEPDPVMPPPAPIRTADAPPKPVAQEDPKLKTARLQLAQARSAVKAGDVDKAEAGLQAIDRTVAFPGGEDNPAAVRKDLDALKASRAVAQVTPPPPPPVSGGLPPISTNDPGVKPVVGVAQNPPVAAPPSAVPAVDTKKEQAIMLLGDSIKLLNEGKIVEARQKAVEAQKLGASYGPNESSPDQMILFVANRARLKMNGMVSEAGRVATDPTCGDLAARTDKAEKLLLEAQFLGMACALDTAPVQAKLKWVREQRTPPAAVVAQNPPVPPALPDALRTNPTEVNPVKPVPPQTGGPMAAAPKPSEEGPKLLEQARLELQRGQLGTARKIALEACAPKYGVQEHAFNVLRTIDAEEFAQKNLVTRRTFDAAEAAFIRGDFTQAASLLGSVTPQSLDTTRQEKYRQLMARAELKPVEQVATRVEDKDPVRTTPAPGAVGTNPSEPPGKVTVTDSGEDSLLAKTQGMRAIVFGKLRQEGLDIQGKATELSRNGQFEDALRMLQDYLDNLADNTTLTGQQINQLKRPVESRIQQFKLLAQQQEFRDKSGGNKVAEVRGNLERNEANKQKKVAELAAQYNALLKENKFNEARGVAMKWKEYDPDNPAAAAAVMIATTQANQASYDRIKNNNKETVLGMLNANDDLGPYPGEGGLKYDKELWTDRVKNRKPALGGPIGPRKTPKEREIEHKLQLPTSCNFVNTPLRSALYDLQMQHGLNMHIAETAIEGEGIDLNRPITARFEQISLKSALNLLLNEVKLTYHVRHEVLEITTPSNARGQLVREVFNVADLVVDLHRTGGGAPPGQPGNPALSTVPSSPRPVMNGLNYGTPTGSPSGTEYTPGGDGHSAFGSDGSPVQTVRRAAVTREEELIRLITETVGLNTWAEQGGKGTIHYFPMTQTLVINQTTDILEQVTDLLEALRRLQNQEVAIEVRFISVSEDFYERMGMDFDLKIKTDKETAKYEPALTAGIFKPAPYLNDFSPSRLITGLTPAGTLTSDLDIPINNDTFQMTRIPFGGYPGIPGAGGIALGLAFLSDIQVFMFLEAVQGDVRNSIMTAPKITLTNNDPFAFITVNEGQKQYVTGVTVQNQNGQIIFQPTFGNFATQGVSLNMTAVITADRRFVRLQPTISLTNTRVGVVPQFPITVPVFPTFGVDATGNPAPVILTQFIQQPIVDNITVTTTVVVPDGGTVVLGGLKRLSEARSEFGPPILGKIPYINRLFRNVGYGRESVSLLILITPRIIIQEEEEERQTGFRATPNLFP